MKQPTGFIHPDFPDHVYKLWKAIYGLKQVPCAWFNQFSGALLSLGFCSSKADTSLFIYSPILATIILLVYVNDIIVCLNNINLLHELLRQLSFVFFMKDLGPLNFFLGIEAYFCKDGLLLSHSKYYQNYSTSSTWTISSCSTRHLPPSTPYPSTKVIFLSNQSSIDKWFDALQYVTMTRPYISLAVSTVSQFMHQLCALHLEVLKRIFRYLGNTPSHALFLQNQPCIHLHAYVDDDWARCYDTGQSTSGLCLFLDPSIVPWRAKKQATMARPNTEVEYQSMVDCVVEPTWLQQLLVEIGISLTSVLWCSVTTFQQPIYL